MKTVMKPKSLKPKRVITQDDTKIFKPSFKYKYHVGDIVWDYVPDPYDIANGEQLIKREIVAVIFIDKKNTLLYATKHILGDEFHAPLIDPTDRVTYYFIELAPGQKTRVDMGLYLSESDIVGCEPMTDLKRQELQMKKEIGI